MEYFFKINNNDYSMYVNKLMVTREHIYKSGLNSSGTTWVKYQNSKARLEVGIIPIDDVAMAKLLADVDKFKITVSYRDPRTNTLTENLDCIITDYRTEYHTIQANKVMYKTLTLQITEL